MKASVIIPCHNAGPWIAKSLQSVAAQALPAHEIFVIDDASTDDSAQQVKNSGVDVTLLHTEFRNAAAARNAGIERATGDWIAFLDADDYWLPNHLRRAGELLDGGVDVAFTANHWFVDVDGNEQPIPEKRYAGLTEPRTGIPGEDYPELVTRHFPFGHSTVLLRRDRVEAVGRFDVTQKRRHDMDLWLKVLSGHTWTYDHERHAGYRVDTPGSISRNLINCEYFYLRTLVRHREQYPTPAMQQLIDTSARRAMSLAFVDGDARDYELAKSIAWPHLRGGFQAFYRLAGLWPGLFRSLIRLKRQARPVGQTPR